MAEAAILRVQISGEAYSALLQAAPTHDAAGACAMAREILEGWAQDSAAQADRESLQRTIASLREHGGWNDEPADFFPIP